jgi:hypothetical protein
VNLSFTSSHCIVRDTIYRCTARSGLNAHLAMIPYDLPNMMEGREKSAGGGAVINIWLYNHVFINIILSMPYKYNLSDVVINVFLESFSERKICCSIIIANEYLV